MKPNYNWCMSVLSGIWSFLNKNFICLFVSLGVGASVAIIRQLCFLSIMWVLGINSGHQVWGNMVLHAAPSRASGDLTFYLFLMSNSYLLNFLFCQRDSGSFFFSLHLLRIPFMMFRVGGEWTNKNMSVQGASWDCNMVPALNRKARLVCSAGIHWRFCLLRCLTRRSF